MLQSVSGCAFFEKKEEHFLNMKTIEWPYCGASIEADIVGRDSVFCNYCGKQIALNDENSITKCVCQLETA